VTHPAAGLVDRLDEATAFLRARIAPRAPTVGLVLGSGLGAFASRLADAAAIDYASIPHFPVSTVVGHAGRLVVGKLDGVTCAALQGRAHFYEGHDLVAATFPVRALIRLGVRTLVITNAAGGVNRAFAGGALMVIRDHLNLFGASPLSGPNDERLGPRFPDMTRAYAPELCALAHGVARGLGIELVEGVYAGLPGPCYETPAEVEMLRRLGADAVGMSTVPETIVANHMGARVLGISCITNAAAGATATPLTHDEVTETARRVEGTFGRLLAGIVEELGKAEAP
jgi:purine-nucleoside phosphorylase